MNQEIYCSVSSCHYWGSGNHCQSDKIFVTSDAFGADQPDDYDVMQASTAPQTPTNTCMETSCKTFVMKRNPKLNIDGAHKQSR